MSEHDDRRCAWSMRQHARCPVCRLNDATETHHLAGRNKKRPDLYEEPFNWLRTCRTCHEDHGHSSPAIVMAVAKFMANPDEFDLARLQRLKPHKFYFRAHTIKELARWMTRRSPT